MDTKEIAKKIVEAFDLTKPIYICPNCGNSLKENESDYFYCRECKSNDNYRNAKVIYPLEFVEGILNKKEL